MKPIAYINVEKRRLEFAEPIKWHTPTVANLDRIPLFTKEALAQEQEPVAFWNFNSGFSHCMIDQLNEAAKKNPAPLYTTPPQRTWQGLTEEDKKQMFKEANYHWEMTAGEYAERIGQLTEAKLKERNT